MAHEPLNAWLRRQRMALVAVAYPACLGAVWWLLQAVGEDHWLLGVALYLPRALFALPLAVLLPWLIRARRYGLCALQLVSLGLLWFPLLGWHQPLSREPPARGPALRVMTYNADVCRETFDGMVERVRRAAPDVALLQEVCVNADYVVQKLRQTYRVARLDGGFLIASRYPLRSFELGDALPEPGWPATPRHVRYELDTPLGRIVFYSLHPTSLRPALLAARDLAQRDLFGAGGLLRGGGAALFRQNLRLRARQLALVMRRARADGPRVVLAGDSNLPELSHLAFRYFSGFQDAFEARGSGFGYTYPARLPWLRLDRVLTGAGLRARSVWVGTGSDHLSVIATVERAL